MPGIQARALDLLKAVVLLLAADQGVIELGESDLSFISQTLDGHVLKA